MTEIVIEHVKVEELPSAWRAKLGAVADARVTVRIAPETQTAAQDEPQFTTDDPAFGIWRDREDMADAAAYVRKIRSPRYGRDGSRNEP